MCYEHRNTEENKRILEEYKARFIPSHGNAPQFSKEIKLLFMTQLIYISTKSAEKRSKKESIISENRIYLLQKIQVDNQQYTIFFDSGCSDMVVKYDAVLKLGSRAKQVVKGTILLGGIGNLDMESKHGIYQIIISLNNGRNAVLAGVCLDDLRNSFATYPINGKIQDEINEVYKNRGVILELYPNSMTQLEWHNNVKMY